MRIVEALIREGASVRAYDPAAMEEARMMLRDLECAEDPYDAARDVMP